MSKRTEWIDFAKGVSIVLVVLFHTTIAMDKYNLTHDRYWLANSLFSSVRMPLFFLVSGILARSAIQRDWRELFQRKILFFIYIFVLWSLLHLTWNRLIPVFPSPEPSAWITFIYSPTTVLWFIWALAFYFIVAKAGLAIGKTGVFVGALVISTAAYAGMFRFENYAHENVLQFLPFFLYGAWFSQGLLSTPLFSHRATLVIAVPVFLLAFFAIYKHMLPQALEHVALLPLAPLGIVAAISLAVAACRSSVGKAIPVYLGKNTLPIYVAHSPLVSLLAYLVGTGAPDLAYGEVWAVPAVAIAATILSLLIKVSADSFGAKWLFQLPDLSKRRVTQLRSESESG
jgi:uncharacterized membrane protein YcfT